MKERFRKKEGAFTFKIAAPFTTRPHLPVAVERVGLTDRSVLHWTREQNNRREHKSCKSPWLTHSNFYIVFWLTLSHRFSVPENIIGLHFFTFSDEKASGACPSEASIAVVLDGCLLALDKRSHLQSCYCFSCIWQSKCW